MQFNPFSPDFQRDPYPYYAMLRSFQPMFHWAEWRSWFLTSYEDNNTLLRDKRLGREVWRIPHRDLPQEFISFLALDRNLLLFRDPPDHTRLRGLVHKAFTPRMVEQLRERIEAITDDLLNQMTGTVDLVEALAYPLPLTVIAELLGVPPKDRPRLRNWSRAIVTMLEIRPSQQEIRAASSSAVEFTGYLINLIQQRRRQPQDDLLSQLIQVQEEQDHLTENELIGTAMLLLVAGHETTLNLIGCGMLALLKHPDQLQLLRDAPGMIRQAVEEMLRYDSPIQIANRFVMEAFEYNGQQFRRGEQIIFALGAANRDAERFPQPETFNIHRTDNPHLAFGSGIHYCLGAPLARLEAEIAISHLLRRFPNIRLGDGKAAYRSSFVLRGLKALPVRL